MLLKFQSYGPAAETVSGVAGMGGKSLGVCCEYYPSRDRLCAVSAVNSDKVFSNVSLVLIKLVVELIL